MMKQLQLFLSVKDESALSALLRAELPDIRFLNGNVWRDKPEERNGIEDCASGRVYLYDRPVESLPTMRRKTGDLEGPIGGCVIQILRCKCTDGTLLSGRVAAGINDDDQHMRSFLLAVWACVRKVGKIGVVRPDGGIDRNYLVGDDAREMAVSGNLKIADRAVGLPYEPLVQKKRRAARTSSDIEPDGEGNLV